MPIGPARLSIRSRLALLTAAILLPAVLMLIWSLAAEVDRARGAAHEKVRILATAAAATLQAKLAQSETVLARLASRPLVKALDPLRCDPIVAEFVRLNPEYLALHVLDAKGHRVCSPVSNPARAMTAAESHGFDAAWRAGRFLSGEVTVDELTGRRLIALSYPVRDDARVQIGLVVLAIDLLTLNQELLASTPRDAVVAVVDAKRAILLRSSDPESSIGTRAHAALEGPAEGPREGILYAPGRDGVPRLYAFLTLPDLDWRVSANMPEAQVLADYRSTLHRTIGLGAVVILLAFGLAWRLSVAIARPISGLASAAAAVAEGHVGVRADEDAPAEIRLVAGQFNRMLDTRDANEAARREVDARYHTLVDWLPDAISVHVDGRVRFVNQACADLLGTRAQDLLGTPSLDVLHGEFHREVLDRVAEAMSGGQPIPPHDQQFIRADGTTVDVEVSATPVVYEGKPALLAAMRDVTPRKVAEARLAKSEAQLRGIVESATVAIISVDEAQRIISANPAAASMFGRRIADLLGAPLDTLIPERYRASHGESVHRFGSAESSPRHMGNRRDVVGLRASGEAFPVDAAISHLSVGGERLYTVILRDISERRRAESALRESEATLRRLLVTLPESVFVNTGGRISFVNEAAEALFHADESRLLGRDPLTLIHPDSTDAVRRRIAALLGGRQMTPLEQVKIVRDDGAVRLVESAATLLPNHGEPAVVVVMRDVTALVEAREALSHTHAELQRLLAAQDRVQEDERKRIARELHDDLQQTLAAIRIDLVAAAQRLDSAPGEVAPLLEEIGELAATALESTRRLINDLRPQMLEDLGLLPALQSLAAQFSRRTGVACRVREHDERGHDTPLPSATATCLYRVAQEALANVHKHAAATRVRMLLLRGADGHVVLRIRDDGRGMVTGEPRKPASFGLLGMHERVRAMGATLRVDSRPGAGTTIVVHVPPEQAMVRVDHVPSVPVVGLAATTGAAGVLLPGIIDALDGNVAVLDRQGTIVLVNRAWQAFAARGGDAEMRHCGPGANYLDVCRRSAADDASAARALRGLAAVLEGREASCVLEYPCDAPDRSLWFRMHAAPIDAARIIVMHVEIGAPDDAARPDKAVDPGAD